MRLVQSFLSIFLLLVFAAVPAHADRIFIDPGAVDGNAQDFTFFAEETEFVDIRWTDNKTLEYSSGRHLTFLFGQSCASYAGVLLDAAGKAIPDSDFVGRAVCTSGSDLSAGVINLPTATVFSGIRLFSGAFEASSGWQWNWKSDDRPIVGQREVSGNQPPVALAGGRYSGIRGTPITFDASNSFDPDGTITSHCWDFGDETFLCGEIIPHTYANGGIYNVTLTVTDDMGVPDSTHTIASIGTNSFRPKADAGGPYFGETGTQVQFDGTGSSDPDGTVDLYTWDFGDNSSPISGLATPQHGYSSPGTYNVVLQITDDTGDTDIAITRAFISDGNKAPIADAGPPVVGEINVPVAFDASVSNDPDGQIVRYDWDYGDGNTGPDAGATPSHTYNAADEYTVTVTVTDDLGAVDTDQTAASISPPSTPPTADAGGPYSALVGVEVTFDGTGSSDAQGPIATYEWDFGDGSAAGSGATPSHTYTVAGNYTVTLRVTDGEGLTDTDTAQATVAVGNEPPTADPNGPYFGVAGVAVTFDGSGSSDPEGDIAQYDWDFGDTTVATDAGSNPSHTYAAAGTYQVALTVTDADGVTNTEVTGATIDAANVPPAADANGPYIGTVGTTVVFDGSASSDADGSIASYAWDFGDGGTGTGEMPSYTYAAAGTYDVTLTVTDNDGASSPEAFSTAAIDSPNVPPVADAGGPYVGKVNVEVVFDGSGSTDSDGTVARYDWEFGDGNTAIDGGAAPVNTYTATGLYDIVLTVTDNDGVTAKSSTQVLIGDGVNLPPTADPGGPYTGDEGVAVSFDGSGSRDRDGTIATYDWDFGDNSTGTGATPSHTYATAGNYPITLTVTDDGGRTNTATTTASIGMGNQPPTAEAGGPYSGLVNAEIFFNGSGSSDPDGDVLSATWDFGDSDSADGLSANHTYTASGLYRATLTVTDAENQTDSDSAVVVVSVGNAPPVAEAGGPYSGTANTAVTFDGSASADPDGSIDTYAWTFGDTGTGNGATVDHAYTAAGVYNVIVEVTDDGGLTASDTTTASVGAASAPPTADAGGPYNGTVDAAISFDASGSSDPDGDIDRYDWNYGDGNNGPDAGAMPSHTYATDGKFVVTVTVTDASGEVATDSANVTIGVGNQAPAADAGPVVSGAAGASITFDGSASSDPDGTIENYDWAFGDGSSGTGANPSHVYDTVGDFNVTLTVTDNSGAVSSDVTVATVTQATVSVQSKTRGGGSLGIVDLLLLAAAALLAVSRASRIAANRTLVLALAGILMLASPGSGHAQDIEWYAGVGAGAADADYNTDSFAPAMADRGHTVTNVNIDTSDTGWQLYAGLTTATYFSFELGYVDLGEISASFDADTADVDQMLQDANELLPLTGSGFDLAAIGRWPFGDRGAVFAKIGMFFWEAEDALSASGSGIEQSGTPKTDGNDVMYGIGGELYFPNFAGGRLGVRAEWERYGVDRNDVDLISASILMRF